MFPGRYHAAPDNMWAFWNPQTMGLQGQFCGGDLMNQQSQAQSQVQTQAQLAALREQNTILNQQLVSQAQSHIQHLQQLLPFHQSTFNPHPAQPTPTVPEPPTPVAPQSTPPGSSVSFNAEEMMQQMKNTVGSSMQAFVDKNQERHMNQPPTPVQPPIQATPPIPSHPPPPDEVPPPQHPPRRSRSRSHRHRGAPDKRPISIPRSPRRAKSPRRTHRSSRPRSSHRRQHSTSRDRSRRPSRATSVTLRSASPRRREVLPDNDDLRRDEPSHEPATLHPASWEHQRYQQDPSSHNEYYHSMTTNTLTSHPRTSGNPGTNGRNIQSLSIEPIHRVGLTIPKLPPNTTVIMTLPTSLPPNHSRRHSPPTVHENLHTDQAQSNLVHPPVPSLQDMFPSIFKMARKKNGPVISRMP